MTAQPFAFEPDWDPAILASLKPGAVVKDRFRLERKLGVGNFGIVFTARDLRNEQHADLIAIKFLPPYLFNQPAVLDALTGAVRKARELVHPNIHAVYDVDRDGALTYIRSELLEGETLARVIRGPKPLSVAETWPIIQGAGAALAHAHAHGIVHSDFNPLKVFITTDQRVKVFDFGIRRAAMRYFAEAVPSEIYRAPARTPRYESLQRIEGLPPDPRDDVYSLAFVSYVLLADRYPYNHAYHARQRGLLPPKIPGVLKRRMRALERGLALERERRTPSVDGFLAELEAKPRWRRWLHFGE